ncbi:unnamed protein product [Caenorhabditis brenneri]
MSENEAEQRGRQLECENKHVNCHTQMGADDLPTCVIATDHWEEIVAGADDGHVHFENWASCQQKRHLAATATCLLLAGTIYQAIGKLPSWKPSNYVDQNLFGTEFRPNLLTCK